MKNTVSPLQITPVNRNAIGPFAEPAYKTMLSAILRAHPQNTVGCSTCLRIEYSLLNPDG